MENTNWREIFERETIHWKDRPENAYIEWLERKLGESNEYVPGPRAPSTVDVGSTHIVIHKIQVISKPIYCYTAENEQHYSNLRILLDEYFDIVKPAKEIQEIYERVLNAVRAFYESPI